MANKRRKYLVNKRLQLQFVFLLIMQAAIPIILLGGSLYVVNEMYLSTMQIMVGKEALSDTYVKGILNFSILSILALLVITAILLTYIGIRFSHHIAGPLYKLEETMDKLARGVRVPLIHFRKTDAVNGLANKLNVIIEELNKTRK